MLAVDWRNTHALILMVGLQEWHQAYKKLGVGLLVVSIRLQLCTFYSTTTSIILIKSKMETF